MDKRIPEFICVRNAIRILATALLMTLVATACSRESRTPVTKINTGPTQEMDIQVPMPESTTSGLVLKLEFVSGELNLAPGANGHLAYGKATFNVEDFKPKIENAGSVYTLRTGIVGLESFQKIPKDLKNSWDLHLANTPMSLHIKAGPYNGNFELGGLSLSELVIDEIGSKLTGMFSKPNQVKMSSFTLSTGGSSMILKGLANANFELMTFSSGAGDYTLSFDGKLQRDAAVSIDSGVSTVNIIFPQGANAQVTFDGGLTGVNTSGGWSKNDKVYTLSGSGPTITIKVKMGMGSLNLKSE